MKSYALFMAMLATSTLILACNPNTSADEDYQRRLKERLDAIERETNDTIDKAKLDIDAFAKMQTQGGMPGSIFLSDALLVEGQDPLLPDPRLQIDLHPGTGLDGKAVALDRSQFIKRQDMPNPVVQSIQAATTSKTYINLNCPLLDPAEIEGLKPVKIKIRKAFVEASATKIFMCGQKRAHYNIGFLNAQEIIMKDADYEMKGGHSKWMILQAETLTLIGQNRLAIAGLQIKDPGLQMGGSFSLSILKPLQGDGTLVLQAAGASYKAPGSN